MGKKGRDDVPNPNSVTNRDIIQRLNFLYQASVYLHNASSQPSASPATTSSPLPIEHKKRKKQKITTNDLAQFYVKSMKTVGQKTTVKMDPAVKRTICRECNVALVPGLTATVRVKPSSSHWHAMVYTCTSCGTPRRVPAPPGPAQEPAEDPLTPYQPDELGDIPDSAQSQVVDIVDAAEIGATGPPTPEAMNRSRRKKRAPTRHEPPLFARDVGHVVFCGNDKIEMEPERGNGIYIS